MTELKVYDWANDRRGVIVEMDDRNAKIIWEGATEDQAEDIAVDRLTRYFERYVLDIAAYRELSVTHDY